MIRYALVSAHNTSRSTIERYLPDNYKVLGELEYEGDDRMMAGSCVIVGGHDNAGWTMDDYVIPRLASGLITATEIQLSHPAMKRVPDGGWDVVAERISILADAHRLDRSLQSEIDYDGPGAFQGIADRELAIAIDTIGGHGFADQEAGSVEHGLHGVRVARWIVWTDDQGFKSLRAFDDETAAVLALDEEEEHQNAGVEQ